MVEKLTPKDILNDPSSSSWIRDTLTSALTRDPVDAANDAEVLASVLKDRCDEIQRNFMPLAITPARFPPPIQQGTIPASDIREAVTNAKVTPYPNGTKLCTRCLTRLNEYGLCHCLPPLDDEAP